MMKRFNYTGRKKIAKQHTHIKLHGTLQNSPVVSVEVSLKEYNFPLDSAVYLEAYKSVSLGFTRYSLGKTQDKILENAIEISDFKDAERLKFRIKVVDTDSGKLYGIADRIFPSDKDGNSNIAGILPVQTKNLEQYGVLWRVEIDGSDAVLQIDSQLGNKEQVVRSVFFRGMILPAVLRQILTTVLHRGWDPDLSDLDEFSNRWMKFVQQIGGELPNSEEVPDNEIETDVWLAGVEKLLVSTIGIREKTIEEYSTGGIK